MKSICVRSWSVKLSSMDIKEIKRVSMDVRLKGEVGVV